MLWHIERFFADYWRLDYLILKIQFLVAANWVTPSVSKSTSTAFVLLECTDFQAVAGPSIWHKEDKVQAYVIIHVAYCGKTVVSLLCTDAMFMYHIVELHSWAEPRGQVSVVGPVCFNCQYVQCGLTLIFFCECWLFQKFQIMSVYWFPLDPRNCTTSGEDKHTCMLCKNNVDFWKLLFRIWAV